MTQLCTRAGVNSSLACASTRQDKVGATPDLICVTWSSLTLNCGARYSHGIVAGARGMDD